MTGSPAATASPKSSAEEIKQARRRLSVMSDNKLVEGFESAVNLDEPEEVGKFTFVTARLNVYSYFACWRYRWLLHLLMVDLL